MDCVYGLVYLLELSIYRKCPAGKSIQLIVLNCTYIIPTGLLHY